MKGSLFTFTIATLVEGETITEPLNEREQEVLKHPTRPISTPQIAEQPALSASTVWTPAGDARRYCRRRS